MPKMSLTIPHRLTQEEALERIHSLLGDLKKQHGDQITDLKEDWQGNRCAFSFKVMGLRPNARNCSLRTLNSFSGDSLRGLM